MTLLLHLLMLSLLSGGLAEVVDHFENKCGQFFAKGKSPTVLPGQQYKQICQTLNGVAYFATLYDTNNKIPVYSAYKFEGLKSCTRKNSWYIEPQLDGKAEANMSTEASVQKNVRGLHQALNADYVDSDYDKGHLAPVYHSNSQFCADATFTLTNAAPQNPCFNRIRWWDIEEKMAEELSNNCLNKYSVYVVTGVVPGTETLKKANKPPRVTVPSHFWTAFCCLDQNNKCQISGGFIGENKDDKPIRKTQDQLEDQLKTLYKVKVFELFGTLSEPPAKKKKIQN